MAPSRKSLMWRRLRKPLSATVTISLSKWQHGWIARPFLSKAP